MALAPAIMLNKRYHWVPSSMRRIAASVSSPGQAQNQQEQDREKGGGGQRGGDLHHRLQPGGQARVRADGDPHRNGPRQGDEQGDDHPEQGDERAQGDVAPFLQREGPEHLGGQKSAIERSQAGSRQQEIPDPGTPAPRLTFRLRGHKGM